MATQDANEQWGILEIMGHRKAAGLVREVTRFGAQMAQVDIPEVPAVDEKWSAPEGTPGRYQIRDAQPAIPAHTQLYGGHSIFCFTPTSEAVAREAAARFRQAPPKVLDAPTRVGRERRHAGRGGPRRRAARGPHALAHRRRRGRRRR
jgi:hypothetical protein